MQGLSHHAAATRPGFMNGIRALAESNAPVPALPSIEIWRSGKRDKPYDPNVDASRNELRSFVCGPTRANARLTA